MIQKDERQRLRKLLALNELIRLSEELDLYNLKLQVCQTNNCSTNGYLTRVGDGKSLVLCDEHYKLRFGYSRS